MGFILEYPNFSRFAHIGVYILVSSFWTILNEHIYCPSWCMRRFAVILCLSCYSVLIAGREERRQPLPKGGHEDPQETEEHGSGRPTQTTSFSSPNITTVVLVTTATATQTVSPSATGITFQFNDLPNTTVCNSLLLSWLYSSQEVVNITIIVQSSTRNFTNPPLISSALPPSPSENITTVTTDALSIADNFRWSPVNVNVGWYIAKAFDTPATLNISTISAPFHVNPSEDTSCLNQANEVSTSGSTSPTRTSTVTVSSKSSIPAGDIAAIVIGGIAGILLLVAFIFPRWRRHKLAQQKEGRPHLLY